MRRGEVEKGPAVWRYSLPVSKPRYRGEPAGNWNISCPYTSRHMWPHNSTDNGRLRRNIPMNRKSVSCDLGQIVYWNSGLCLTITLAICREKINQCRVVWIFNTIIMTAAHRHWCDKSQFLNLNPCYYFNKVKEKCFKNSDDGKTGEAGFLRFLLDPVREGSSKF